MSYDCQDPVLPGESPETYADGLWADCAPPKHQDLNDGFCRLSKHYGSYIVFKVNAESILMFNSVQLKIDRDCVLHFPYSAMWATDISVSPKPTEINYRYHDTDTEEHFRGNRIEMLLPGNLTGYLDSGTLVISR